MGRAEPDSVPPAALGNLELMKVVCVCVCVRVRVCVRVHVRVRALYTCSVQMVSSQMSTLPQIPNFFHLTPPAIKKHCQALKRKHSFIQKLIHNILGPDKPVIPVQLFQAC